MRFNPLILGLLFVVGLSLVACAPLQVPYAGAPGLGDTFYPLMGNGGYDVQHYTLDLDVDVPTNIITATATILSGGNPSALQLQPGPRRLDRRIRHR